MARSLTRRRIAQAALAVADADGLDAVSTRRVGADLGVSAMALYRHVDGRNGLLAAMAALAAEETRTAPAPGAGWRDGLTAVAESGWRAFEAHPWMLPLALAPDRVLNLTPRQTLADVLDRLRVAGLAEDDAFDALLGAAGIPVGVAALTGLGHTRPPRVVDASEELAEPAGQDAAPDPLAADRRVPTPGADDPAPFAALHARGLAGTVARRVHDLTLAAYLDGIDRRIRRSATHPARSTDPDGSPR